MFFNTFNKKKILDESIKYISNSLIKIANDGKGNVIGISSSTDCKKTNFILFEAIAKEIKLQGVNVKTVTLEGKIGGKKELAELIEKEKNKNDIVLVYIPPIPLFADSIEYSKICNRILLLERYRYSFYKNYEETLLRIKAHEVNLEGIIAYGD